MIADPTPIKVPCKRRPTMINVTIFVWINKIAETNIIFIASKHCFLVKADRNTLLNNAPTHALAGIQAVKNPCAKALSNYKLKMAIKSSNLMALKYTIA